MLPRPGQTVILLFFRDDPSRPHQSMLSLSPGASIRQLFRGLKDPGPIKVHSLFLSRVCVIPEWLAPLRLL